MSLEAAKRTAEGFIVLRQLKHKVNIRATRWGEEGVQPGAPTVVLHASRIDLKVKMLPYITFNKAKLRGKPIHFNISASMLNNLKIIISINY